MALSPRHAWFAILVFSATFAVPEVASAVPAAVPPLAPVVGPNDYADLRWRLLGPFRGGWATAVAGLPGEPASFLFGAADGGVWKTTDAGVTWRPLFERDRASSIGALAIAPSDPRVIWIGTGQVHQRWDVVSGEGLFRSTDGGVTWNPAGLRDSRHIGKIWVDPNNADVAVVAALGHLFGPGGDRGLFRTEDGGKSWQQVLYRRPGRSAGTPGWTTSSRPRDPAVPSTPRPMADAPGPLAVAAVGPPGISDGSRWRSLREAPATRSGRRSLARASSARPTAVRPGR